MADDDKVTPPVAETPTAETPAPPTQPTAIFGLPIDMFVKGGTTSFGHDMKIKADEADAEARRNAAQRERQLAQVPVEHGGAKLYTSQMTEHQDVEKAYVLLDYMTARGEPMRDHGEPVQCLADVMVLPDGELQLIIVCPKCKETRPLGQCQIKIRQTNKHWELNTGKAGELIIFDGVPYRSAGVITESERFTCGYCGVWSARISNNKVRPE